MIRVGLIVGLLGASPALAQTAAPSPGPTADPATSNTQPATATTPSNPQSAPVPAAPPGNVPPDVVAPAK